jgi:hypothetical protein
LDDQQELARRGGWLLQSAIGAVPRQAKSRALAAVVRGPEIRQKRVRLLDLALFAERSLVRRRQ